MEGFDILYVGGFGSSDTIPNEIAMVDSEGWTGTWWTYQDLSPQPWNTYNISGGIPTSYIFDRDGHARYRRVGSGWNASEIAGYVNDLL
jgi:hypothetical protein